MARVDYDTLAGTLRIAAAGEKPNAFAVEVLTYHAAIEAEVDILLKRLVQRPEKILSGRGRLNFSQKAAVVNACWQGDPAAGDKLESILVALNELRNAVAHNDTKQVHSCFKNLVSAYREIDPDIQHDPSVLQLAQGICRFMGDDGIAERLQELSRWFDKIAGDVPLVIKLAK